MIQDNNPFEDFTLTDDGVDSPFDEGTAGKSTEDEGTAGKSTEDKGTAGKSTEDKGTVDKTTEDEGTADKSTEGEGTADKSTEDETIDNPFDNKKDESIEKDNESLSTLKHLKERGFLDVEIPEDKTYDDLSKEDIDYLLEKSYTQRIQKDLKNVFEQMPDDLKHINNFVYNGGTVSQYLENLNKQNINEIDMNIDLEKVDNQKKVIIDKYSKMGIDKDVIESSIEKMESQGVLQNNAEKAFNELIENNKKKESLILEEQNKRKEEQENQFKRWNNDIYNAVHSNKLDDFSVGIKDKDELPNFISNRSIETTDGDYISPMQKALYNLLANPLGTVQLAQLLKQSNEDGTLNLKFLEKNIKTKTTKDIMKNIYNPSKRKETDDNLKNEIPENKHIIKQNLTNDFII